MLDDNMKKPVILIGVGEMGGVFARGFLRLGHPVYPVTRETDMPQLTSQLDAPALVIVAVGEADLQRTLASLPDQWKSHLLLLQNELLPRDFAAFHDVTVISVWFEKKPGSDAKVIIPSPVYGPDAQLVADALGVIGIATNVLTSAEQLEFELVVKNLYILTTNIAGLQTGGNVGELWDTHRQITREVGTDIIALQEALTGSSFDHDALFNAMVNAFHGDLQHQCMGRSAPARLKRALEHAESLGVETPALQKIAQQANL